MIRCRSFLNSVGVYGRGNSRNAHAHEGGREGDLRHAMVFERSLVLSRAGQNPVEVTGCAGIEREGNDLRRIVGVEVEDEFLERGEVASRGLEQDEKLAAAFELSLPPVVRFEAGNNIRAGNEFGREGGFGEGACGFAIRCGDKNESDGARGFHAS